MFGYREALELEELIQIKEVNLDKDGQKIIRDNFIFSCYTGLSFADVYLLINNHLDTDIEDEKWIEMIRRKTANFSGKKFFVLLFPEAIELINK
ncbi:hypothetical protein SAMN05421821_102113 [Mucilaginibacter lappiensis]|uniref:Uncharacterized protein n=1 Tax=Mucilaginibacter lappiensis TaxID=354630 RepID=A0ABR6PFY3_9SPHI|nr:hypothetical protein [Mucilaginibacter lappiensis]MBB6108652.1 hypothetical protein [Mucilaginibacter lappiensis]SIQ29254.1 hypothetical protein SAMN05421821_102113 [Mucilaginibacter lappiensis]